jgi:hypothetical protein
VQTAHKQQPGPTLHANGRHQREGAAGSTVPFQPLLGTVVGGTPLHHKASGRLRLGRRPILFGTVAYRWRLPAGGLRSVSVAMHTVVHQSKGTEPIDKQRSWTICKQCGLRGLFAGCLQTMWSHLRLLWVRRPACLQRMWADEYLCLWVSLRMIVGRYSYLSLRFCNLFSQCNHRRSPRPSPR